MNLTESETLTLKNGFELIKFVEDEETETYFLPNQKYVFTFENQPFNCIATQVCQHLNFQEIYLKLIQE